MSEVGAWGEPRPVHALPSRRGREDADRLLQLVRERVTASVLLPRHVPVTGRARRTRGRPAARPVGTPEVTWLYEYDEGVDPDDPVVRAGRRGRSGLREPTSG